MAGAGRSRPGSRRRPPAPPSRRQTPCPRPPTSPRNTARAFEALTSGKFDNFCLYSCTANGHPAAAIAAVTVQPSSDRTGEDEYLIAPLFVSVGPGIALLDHDGREA